MRENRGFVRLNLVSLAFTAGAIGLSVLLIAAVVDAPGQLSRMGVQGLEHVSVLRWPVLWGVSMVLISVLYRFAPAQRSGRWRWVTPGNALAASGWIVMSVSLLLVRRQLPGTTTKTYGSLGAIIGFLTWIWLSLMIVLAVARELQL